MTAVAAKIRMRGGRALFLGVVAAAYGFLLLPLVIVVLASFNSGELLTFPPQGSPFAGTNISSTANRC